MTSIEFVALFGVIRKANDGLLLRPYVSNYIALRANIFI